VKRLILSRTIYHRIGRQSISLMFVIVEGN